MLFSVFKRAPEIFEDNYLEKKAKENNLNLSLNLEEKHESINRGETPEELKFSYGGEENDGFIVKVKLLNLTAENERFVGFLMSDYCARIMRENKLAIHIETGNIYFDNFNTKKILYNLILMQQDTSKKILNVRIIFGEDFQQYTRKYLAGIKVKIDEKYDITTNKNSKYLFLQIQ